MAYHYIANARSGAWKTVRTESLTEYKSGGRFHYDGPWQIFDTEEDRDANGARVWWYLREATAETGSLTHSQKGDYERSAGYKIFRTEEEAKAAAPPIRHSVRLADGRIDRITTSVEEMRVRDGSTSKYRVFDTRQEADAFFRTLYRWALNVGNGSVTHISPSDVATYQTGSNRRAYRIFETKAEAEAALTPRYYWDRIARKWTPWTIGCGQPRQFVSHLVEVRAMLRAMKAGSNYFTVNGADFTAAGTTAGLLTRIERKRVLGPIGREAQRAKLTARLNSFMERAQAPHRWHRCKDCMSIMEPLQGRIINGAHICDACRHNYRLCSECSEYHDAQDGVTYDNSWYCNDHIPEDYDGEDGEGLESGELLPYSTDIMAKRRGFLTAAKDQTCGVWLGFELEVHPKAEMAMHKSIAAVQAVSHDWAICKSDSSLSGGYEIVSVPATLQWHRENVMPFLTKVGGMIEGWRHTDCGMHVHVGKEQLSELTLAKLVVFMHEPENQSFITQLAGRDVNDYSKRGQKKTLPAYRSEDDLGRYQALNFATRGRKTIEFRVFRSNVSPAGFIKNMEFCHALVTWCKLASPFEVASEPRGVGMDEKKMDSIRRPGYSNFVRYVGDNRSTYQYLTKWLEENGYLSNPKKALTSPSLAA